VLQSQALAREGVRHGFFTRQGGVSKPPWSSLSFSTGAGDDPAAVAQNFALAADWLGVEPGRIFVLSQVHGCEVRVLEGGELSASVLCEQGDVVLSARRDVACGVRIADCVPVLLVDRRSGFAAAVHAGWRGVARGVVGAAVRALVSRLSAPVDLLAAIGPHIEACCFEVGADVAAELAQASEVGDRAVDRSRQRPHVDLRRIIEAQLVTVAGAPVAVDHVPGCTVCDGARFHSYRRDGPRSGRMLAAVVPPGSPG
jgi:hypothetical protein